MFPQLKKLNNESGIILFIVLMTAIIIMIFSAGILMQSMNENNYAQQQVDQILSDQLAKGLFWNAYSTAYSSGNMTNISSDSGTYNLQNRTYQVTLTPSATNYISTANYDTFQ